MRSAELRKRRALASGREAGARGDPRAVPALRLIVVHHGHVIGEHPAETWIRELFGAHARLRRFGRRLNVECQRRCAIDFFERSSHGVLQLETVFVPGGYRRSKGRFPLWRMARSPVCWPKCRSAITSAPEVKWPLASLFD